MGQPTPLPLILLAALGLILVSGAAPAAPDWNPPPPRFASGAPGRAPAAARAACQGQSPGAACTFTGRMGRPLSGLCREVPSGLACVPLGGPGMPGPPGAAAGPGADREQGPNAAMGRGPAFGQRARNGAPISSRFGYTPRPAPKDQVVLHNKVPATGLTTCFNDQAVISCPKPGQPFYGQDANYKSPPMRFQDHGDGTVSDLNTGLMWQKAHHDQRVSYDQAQAACRALDLGGFHDWRLPSITELFSIADLSGGVSRRFYIDTRYFDFREPDPNAWYGPMHDYRMMGQTWSATQYVGQVMDQPGAVAFFFNFLDGHIKSVQTNPHFHLFYRCVRGPAWGVSDFHANGDGTVTDRASGLMWQRADAGRGMDWPHALAYCQALTLAGHDDWRLPNVKELQTLVDYRRNDPALDLRYFRQSDPKAWFWSSTTHGDNIRMADYVCFGKCVSVTGMDSHGAGAQRADPKTGNPADFPPLGGQRDAVRIFNAVRCVRDAR